MGKRFDSGRRSEGVREGDGDNEFICPRGLSMSRDGLLFIADENNNRVVCYHLDGIVAREWASSTDLQGA